MKVSEIREFLDSFDEDEEFQIIQSGSRDIVINLPNSENFRLSSRISITCDGIIHGADASLFPNTHTFILTPENLKVTQI